MYHPLPESSLIDARSLGGGSCPDSGHAEFFKRTLIKCVILVLGLVWLSTEALGAPITDTFKMGYGFAVNGYSSSKRFSRPGGVFFDTNRSEVYVADSGNGQIVIFDNKGLPITKIPHSVVNPDSGERQSGQPKNVVVKKNGDILVTDSLCSYLDIIDFRGRSIQKIWPADLLGLQRSKVRPQCLAIDSSENVYISLSGDVNEILVLTPELKLKAEIGKINGTDGPSGITGLWVDKDGRIYVTYAQGDCVHVYAPDGKLLANFGKHDSGYNNFSLPSGLITDARGNIWIVDTLRHVVTVFKQQPEGSGILTSVIHAFGGFGPEAGALSYPCAIAGDGVSRIFVLENTGARLQAFDILFTDSTGKPK